MAKFTKGCTVKSFGKWRLSLDRVEPDGTRRRLTRTTEIECSETSNRGVRLARRALEEWRDALEREDERQSLTGSRAPNGVLSGMTLADYAEDYLSHRDLKVTTIEGYEAALIWLKRSEIGKQPIGEVTSAGIEDWVLELKKQGLSSVTRANYYGFAAQVLKYAAACGHIERFPLGIVRAPKKKRKPINALDFTSERLVMETLCRLGPSNTTAMCARVALLTGMRRSEICALRWCDLDFERHVLMVTHSLTKADRVTKARTGQAFTISDPKDTNGADSVRAIPMSNELEACLIERRRWVRAERMKRGLRMSKSLFVMAPPESDTWPSPDNVTNRWRSLASTMGWEGSQGEVVTFHDLRHTFATLAVAMGVDVMSLASILGHKDPSVTLDIYSIALAGPKAQAMDALGTMLAAPSIAGTPKLKTRDAQAQSDARRMARRESSARYKDDWRC